MTLYELTSAQLELLDMMEDPDADPQAIADTLEALDGEIEEKADSYAAVIAQLKADTEALKAEIDRLTARKRTGENSIERMKRALQESMIVTGKTKIKTLKWSFGIQKNPPVLCIDDETAIPEIYKIPQPDKVDNAAIKEMLKTGEACDWAHLEQGESLRIR